VTQWIFLENLHARLILLEIYFINAKKLSEENFIRKYLNYLQNIVQKSQKILQGGILWDLQIFLTQITSFFNYYFFWKLILSQKAKLKDCWAKHCFDFIIGLSKLLIR